MRAVRDFELCKRAVGGSAGAENRDGDTGRGLQGVGGCAGPILLVGV